MTDRPFLQSTFSLIGLVACTTQLTAQTASVSGTISEEIGGKKESVPFANVQLVGTSIGASTDFDGKYAFSAQGGKYRMVVSHVGHESDTVAVELVAGKPLVIDLTLRQSSIAVEAVTVAATRITGTEMSLITDIRNSGTLVTGMTEQQIRETQDRTAADVVRRIPGITIMDGRFIFVRGLAERYNRVLMYDLGTPSIEPDRKAFSFNMLSSSVLERMLIYKTGSPDLPGDFAGGTVRIITRAQAEGRRVNFDYNTGFRVGTTFRNHLSGPRSGTDGLGFDDGSRALPENLATNLASIQSPQVRENETRRFANLWATEEGMAIPDQNLRISYADLIKGKGKVSVSTVNSLAYGRSTRAFTAENNSWLNFIDSLGRSEPIYNYTDAALQEDVRLGVLSNWGFAIGGAHRIDFRNNFDQLGINETVLRTGIHDLENREDRNYNFRYRSNSIYNGQVAGRHRFHEDRWKYEWALGYSYAGREEPDFRKVRYRRSRGSDGPYRLVLPPGASTFDAGRFYSELTEHILSVRQHAEWMAYSKGKHAVSLFGGFFYERKDREFRARWMSYVAGNTAQFDQGILFEPIDSVFRPENISATTGLLMAEGTNMSDAYTASNDLFAGYLGTETVLLENLKLRGGVRIEQNTQRLESGQNLQPVIVNLPLLSVLPSINITLTKRKMLFRAAYFRSVNRPEFRELAPFTYYDFELNNTLAGNPNLTIPDIHNADIGWEWFGRGTDLLRVAVFYKHFSRPIEMVFEVAGGGGTNSFRFRNALSGYSAGAEAEIRYGLMHLTDAPFVRDISIIANASYILSGVDMGEIAAQDRNRPMMGQAPYIANAGLFYTNDPSGVSVNVMYNVVGPRLFAAGTAFDPDIYEMPRHMLDLNVRKRLGQRLEVYATVKNLLNAPFALIQDSDRNGIVNEVDEAIFRFRDGQLIRLGVSVNL
jgi:outer membrane receptor for ferrienterochelin and colicin